MGGKNILMPKFTFTVVYSVDKHVTVAQQCAMDTN